MRGITKKERTQCVFFCFGFLPYVMSITYIWVLEDCIDKTRKLNESYTSGNCVAASKGPMVE